ncbi:hypothetical protein FKG94_12325 [Exilibacterium tricleocarpae]|uniref:DUF4136 domain-containing protein n=1 Tax=Exilibacterium tricleocarpae TaxID=2591008 RepID=A0A545TNQ6_9GAMM|nr:hypothetical protein [Exilibacterium tricleocarpae]TQV78801.1 hypothetical protein FKG94_12325 [Exilibacterium tricleocarpae]
MFGRIYRIGCIVFIGALLAAFLGACAAPTSIKSNWQDPTFAKPPMRKIAVLALFETEADNRRFEQSAVAALRAGGVEAVEGHNVIESARDYSYEELEDKLLNANADGILIFKLIAIDHDHVYRPPTPYAAYSNVHPHDPIYDYYNSTAHYYSYWSAGRQVTRNPAYWEERAYYVVETTLHENTADRLVWTAVSQTYEPDDIGELSRSVIDIVSKRLLEEDLVAVEQ